MATRLLLGLVGVQVVVEISIFLVLFLAMTDTFLFRVGLLGVLVKKFRMVLILHPIYITLTLVTGIYRVHYLAQGNMLYELWLTDSFIFLSSLHKIGMCNMSCCYSSDCIYTITDRLPNFFLHAQTSTYTYCIQLQYHIIY